MRILRMRIEPVRGDEQSVPMWLHAGPGALAGYEPSEGDEIEGFAWLQGVPVAGS